MCSEWDVGLIEFVNFIAFFLLLSTQNPGMINRSVTLIVTGSTSSLPFVIGSIPIQKLSDLLPNFGVGLLHFKQGPSGLLSGQRAIKSSCSTVK